MPGLTPSAAAKRKESTTAAYDPPKKVARQNSQNEPITTASAASKPTSTPQPAPARNAMRRPYRRAIAPAGSMQARSDEHTYELQSLMRITYADFCLKKKNI